MRKILCYQFLCLAVLLMLSFSAKAEVYTTPDGYKVEISLIPDKTEIVLGEPLYLSLEIKNLSDEELGFVNGGDYRNQFGRPDSFLIEVKDSNGLLLPKIDVQNMGGLIGVQRIPVKDKKNIRFLLPHWVNIEKSGDYTITCKKEMQSASIPVNVATQLKVRPVDGLKLGKVIKELGTKTLNESDLESSEAVEAMSFINDERVIRYFVAVINKLAEKPSDRYVPGTAFDALAKFNNDEALQGIVKHIKSDNIGLRRSISLALSRSGHPKAAKYLLKMQNDEAWEIRLDVVHFLGKNKAAWATSILQKMTNDKHEWVRNEARRYLKERGIESNQ
jgi:hypothetical protein